MVFVSSPELGRCIEFELDWIALGTVQMLIWSKGGALGIASLVLIGGALVLMFFVVLSGVKDTTPLNKSWFLRADTSSFPGSGREVSYWTYWKICSSGGGQCGSTIPALPFGAAWVGGTEGVPAGLTGYV